MEATVADTGGKAFYNTNDIRGAIRTAIDDSELTYTLGFYPETDRLDGTYHDLKVSVNRRGLDLRYRKGYVALPDELETPAKRDREIRGLLESPLDTPGISLTAGIEKVDQPKPGSLHVGVRLVPGEVTVERKGDRWVGSLEIAISQRSADGRDLGTVRQTVGLALEQPRYELLVRDGFSVDKTVEPATGTSQLRIVVYDCTSGRAGSLVVPVK
jgi:hypothetical protein